MFWVSAVSKSTARYFCDFMYLLLYLGGDLQPSADNIRGVNEGHRGYFLCNNGGMLLSFALYSSDFTA